MKVQCRGQCHVTPENLRHDSGQMTGRFCISAAPTSEHGFTPHSRPVCQGSDDQPTRVPQVLITILELCVGLADYTVIHILEKQKRMRQRQGFGGGASVNRNGNQQGSETSGGLQVDKLRDLRRVAGGMVWSHERKWVPYGMSSPTPIHGNSCLGSEWP